VSDRLKDIVQSGLGISPDVIFVITGLALFLVTCLITRKPISWAWALIPGLCVSIFVEAVEMRDQYSLHGLTEKNAKDLTTISLRHSRDILIMNLAPLLLVIFANLWFRNSQE
jgi:hypothetical protein